MPYIYNRIIFDYGYEGEGLQEVFDGKQTRLTDLDGNTISIEGPYGFQFINGEAVTPTFALPSEPTPEAPVSYQPPVPISISDRQFFQGLALTGTITQEEAVAAVATGTIPAAMETMIAVLPDEQQFAARMMLAGSTIFERHHPMTEAFVSLYGWSSDEADQFWIFANTL